MSVWDVSQKVIKIKLHEKFLCAPLVIYSFHSKLQQLVVQNEQNTFQTMAIKLQMRSQPLLCSFCCSQTIWWLGMSAVPRRLTDSDAHLTNTLTTMWREGDVEDHGNAEGSRINKLEAILKGPQAKAPLLKKMGIGENTSTHQHPTPRGTNMGGWPPYPLAPLCWLGFFPPFHYGLVAPRAQPTPGTWEGCGLEAQWAWFCLASEESIAAVKPGPSKRPRLEEEDDDRISYEEALELIELARK